MITFVVLAVGRVVVVPYRRRRLMAALFGPSRAMLREMHGGRVVTGRVRREGPPLTAPFSGRSCVAYQVVVKEPQRHGNWLRAKLWGPLLERQQASPFVVATEGSEEALIDVSGPFTLSLAADHSGITDWLTPYPGRHRGLANTLAGAGIAARNFWGTWRSLSYVERILAEDDVVGVDGPGDHEVHHAGDRPTPRSPPRRLVLRGTDEYPLRISAG